MLNLNHDIMQYYQLVIPPIETPNLSVNLWVYNAEIIMRVKRDCNQKPPSEGLA
jgi:hypothetical protein